MDIKRMHEMIEKLSESAECEFAKGIECVDTEEPCITGRLQNQWTNQTQSRFLICLSVTETADGIMTVTGMQTADSRQREEERGEDMTSRLTGT